MDERTILEEMVLRIVRENAKTAFGHEYGTTVSAISTISELEFLLRYMMTTWDT